jgi:DNA-binding transcriptional LysR family regulator/predicted pyridoxine 5'-phosphate oxidase superfamily flavin-nucleotide-binding protein
MNVRSRSRTSSFPPGAFIAARESFYMSSVSETGCPYVQHRGGPAGLLKVIDVETLAFPDYRGNRQYISVGNLSADDGSRSSIALEGPADSLCASGQHGVCRPTRKAGLHVRSTHVECDDLAAAHLPDCDFVVQVGSQKRARSGHGPPSSHCLSQTRYCRLRTRSRGESGRLTIGVHASLSAANLRATPVDHRHRFPDVETQLVDGSSEHLISDVANSAIHVAFVAENYPGRDDRSLSVWSERVVVALPEDHPLASHDIVHWSELRNEALLLPQRGPGPEFLKLLVGKVGHCNPCRLLRHDIGLDRLLTLVGAGWGILLALEGATGAAYPGVTYREVHDTLGPTRLAFRAYWRQANCNPSLPPFLGMRRGRSEVAPLCLMNSNACSPRSTLTSMRPPRRNTTPR